MMREPKAKGGGWVEEMKRRNELPFSTLEPQYYICSFLEIM